VQTSQPKNLLRVVKSQDKKRGKKKKGKRTEKEKEIEKMERNIILLV
jgi:hypothetical protein